MEADALAQIYGGLTRTITQDTDAQGKTFILVETRNTAAFVDMRRLQIGIGLRTFRNRYPLKKTPKKEIVAAIYGVRDAIPSLDEKPYTGKTPARCSKL